MRIGELANATGFSTKTIRFYEQEGLLASPARTDSGYRMFGPQDVTRLHFIKKAKRLGLSLEEAKGILRLHDRQEPTCVHVRSILDEKLAHIDRVLKDLREFRREVVALRDAAGGFNDCRPSGGDICVIIERTGLAATAEAKRWLAPEPNDHKKGQHHG